MTTDRELLEKAAKAAGIVGEYIGGDIVWTDPGQAMHFWCPLRDDGDALRLAVKLHMTVRCYMGNTCAQIGVPGQRNAYEDETNHADPASATRRAIVRAAASLSEAA